VSSRLLTVELIPHGDPIQFSDEHDGKRHTGDLAPEMPDEAARARCAESRPMLFAGPPRITFEMEAARVVRHRIVNRLPSS
jgi:hypothetical protein